MRKDDNMRSASGHVKKARLTQSLLSIITAAALLLGTLPSNLVFAEEADAAEETVTTDADELLEEALAEPEYDIEDDVEIETIVIQSAEEFMKVAENCDLDSWSANKLIELKSDISLAGMDFNGIPVFAGTFNGNGHTISGFRIKGEGYADGFFRNITATGIVQDLKLSGTVVSENDKICTGGLCGINGGWILNCTFTGSVEGKTETGGIAGENEGTATISSCTSYGTVTGYNMAGGIVGANYGAIRNCTNEASINSDNSWLEEQDEAGMEWLFEDVEERKLVSGTDIGGIAGYSRGILINCSNSGVVGYEHNGYNIGGIAGRQSGQILFCNNTGRIYGRKDVGGIVGQMEPYISVEEAESISEAVQTLHDLVERFLDDAGTTQDVVSADFDKMREHSDNALDEADVIANGTTDFIDKNVDAVNEVANRLDYFLDQIPGILDEADAAVANMKDASEALGRAADALDISDDLTDNIYDETDHARLSLVSGVGGDITSDSYAPAAGDEVVITITADPDYKVDAISVEGAAGSKPDLISVSSDDTSRTYQYSFTMPEDNVVVKVSFAYDGSQTSTSGNGTGSVRVGKLTNPTDQSVDTGNTERQITVTKLSGGQTTTDTYSDYYEGNQVVVSAKPDSGCQAVVTITDASGNTITPTVSGNNYRFEMPDADVKVNVEFTRAAVILESNAGGDAECTVSGDVVTLTAKPNTGYAVSGLPNVTVDGDSIPVSSQGTNVYTFELPSDGGTARAYITFKASSEAAAVSSSKSDLSQNVSLLQQQMKVVSSDMDKVETIADGQTISQMQNSSDLADAVLDLAQSLSDTGETLSLIMSDLNTIVNIMTPYMEQALQDAGVEIDDVIDHLETVYDHLDTAFGLIRSTMIYINGQFDIQFAKLGTDVDKSVESLFEQLDIISEYAGKINDDVSTHSDILEEDMRAINDQVNLIFQLFTERLEDVEDLYYDESGYEDISEDDIEESTDGKVERSTNDGVVQGDVNVGGIAGSMAIDEEDPEGNAAGSVNRSFGSKYLTKCVINRCVNNGQITSKKNGVGGIAGYMNLGLIANSEAYGNAESTEGEYVGGVCGESYALIKGCYSLMSLTGSQYVGGIAGSGDRISDCYAMTLINDDAVHQGAIAGWIPTEEDERLDYQENISNNFFVSSKNGGLDDVSYAEIAQPITYEELLETVGLPSEYRHLKLTFIADEKVVDQIEVKYGTPLSQITLPDAPKVAGSYGKWTDISDLTMEGCMTLYAEYNDTITTVASDETVLVAEAGQVKKPYAYIEGVYTDEAKLSANVTELTAAETKESYVGENVPSMVYAVQISNADITDDMVSKLRLYRPYDDIKAVYVQTGDGVWEEISYTEYGQYIQVEMQGDEAVYCIVSGESNTIWIIIAVATAAVAVVLIILVKKKKERAKAKK